MIYARTQKTPGVFVNKEGNEILVEEIAI